MAKLLIEKIMDQIKAALPPDDNGKVVLDADIVYSLLDQMQDIPFSMRLLDATLDRCKEINQIRDEVLKADDKRKAYQSAAKKLGWNIDKRKIERDQIFREYLYLTGVVGLAGEGHRNSDNFEAMIIMPGPLPVQMDKEEAIEFLTKKYQIQSYDATYQRLDEARRKLVSELKAKKFDYSFLEQSILPSTWGTASTIKNKNATEPERKSDCNKYNKCLNKAAHSNASLDCSECKEYEPFN